MFRICFQKPNKCWAFLFLVIGGLAHAGFYEEQVKPVGERAFDSSSRMLLLTGAGSTWFASTQDHQVRSEFRDHRVISPEASRLGDEYGTFLVGPAIALGQFYLDRDNGISHARGLVYTTVVTHLLKETVRRERPDSHNHQSMPSGHSSSAFSTATSLACAYGFKVGMVAYPIATFVAFSRISDDVHWFSDVVAGAFIGIWMGRASCYSTKNIYQTKNFYAPANPQLMPFLSSKAVGFVWADEF